MIPNLFVVEYSKTQDAMHVQDFGGMLENNIKNITSKHFSDYLVVGIFNTHEEALEFSIKLREALDKKDYGWVDKLINYL